MRQPTSRTLVPLTLILSLVLAIGGCQPPADEPPPEAGEPAAAEPAPAAPEPETETPELPEVSDPFTESKPPPPDAGEGEPGDAPALSPEAAEPETPAESEPAERDPDEPMAEEGDPEPATDLDPDDEREVVEPSTDEPDDAADEPETDEPGQGDLRSGVESELDELKKLGQPLVENPDEMQPLAEDQPIWLDMKGRQVVMVGRICQTDAPLELFACLDNTKEHEAIVSLGIEAFRAHTGLMALGAEPGSPVSWDPEYQPATGTEIEVLVRYKDAEGNVQTARAQDWIYNIQAEKAMDHPWVFAGSGFWVDEQSGKKHYRAEEGDFICVSNFSSAMLDLPIESSQANNSLMFRAYTERIPPRGTPVTVLLKPKLENPPAAEEEAPTAEEEAPPLQEGEASAEEEPEDAKPEDAAPVEEQPTDEAEEPQE